MAVISDWVCVDILAILVAIVVGVLTYFNRAYKYWEIRNVPYVKPTFPLGTMGNLFGERKAFGDIYHEQYDEFRAKGHDHVGQFIFSTPIYMPLSPEYIKNILARDFDHFVDRGVYLNEKDDPISANLFSIEGAKWRNLRMKLTPTFTSGKMKMMFQILVECGNQLKEAMDNLSAEKDPVNIKDVLVRFTTNVVGSCAFGLDCNCFKDPNSEFTLHGKRVFTSTKFEEFKQFIAFANPSLAKFLRLRLTPKDSADFFMNVITNTVEYREKNNVVRKDFMQLLVNLKNSEDGKGLTLEELAGQAFVFFIAGYETSSTTMNFCLFELSSNPIIQQKVRDEITTVLEKHDGKITYDAISEMKYMGQVIDETLRKYPPLVVLNRICVKDYKVPDTDFTIENGMQVLIPVLGLQRDPEYFPEPEKFDPERFSNSNRNQIKPFTYLPFGEGPRVCIGLRFGLMQTKVGLTVLLKNYRFSLNEKTKTPLKMDPFNLIMSPLGDIWLNVERVSK